MWASINFCVCVCAKCVGKLNSHSKHGEWGMLYSQEKFFLAEPMAKSWVGNQNTVYLIFPAHVASYVCMTGMWLACDGTCNSGCCLSQLEMAVCLQASLELHWLLSCLTSWGAVKNRAGCSFYLASVQFLKIDHWSKGFNFILFFKASTEILECTVPEHDLCLWMKRSGIQLLLR